MPLKRKRILQILEQTVELRTPVLNLSGCQASEYLDQICQMDWLTELILSNCHIDQLPEAIGKLTLLTRLDLSGNPLSTLPDSISQMSALTHLNLDQVYGFDFKVSMRLIEWLQHIPSVIWPSNELPIAEELKQCFLPPDHPNQWLAWLKEALPLYNEAFNQEERGGNGFPTRYRADAQIRQIFDQRHELENLLPAFYDDFKEHRFYWSNCASEKSLETNPLRLPTASDEAWLAKAESADLLPIQLTDKILYSRRTIFGLNSKTGLQSEIIESEYGVFLVSNQPYAEDERYEANSEATLYQAGRQRLYVHVRLWGQGGSTSIRWLGSDNGGRSWQKQAYLTHDWLAKNCGHWHQLAHLPQLA